MENSVDDTWEMEKTKFPNSCSNYLSGGTKIKTNWITEVAIYINIYYQYMSLNHEENLVFILSNLQTNLFKKDLSNNWTDIDGASD